MIFRVLGLTSEEIRARALTVSMGRNAVLVMHPLHVLRSRLVNLRKVPGKQNAKGRAQLALAIDVARGYLREMAARLDPAALASGRSPMQPLVSEIERMALDDAGRKIAKRHGLHVADAIDPSLIPAGPFWTKKWPELRTSMSPAYAALFKAPGAP